MPKGFFTQSAVVLLDRRAGVQDLERCLRDFEVVRTAEPSENGWMGGAGVIVAMRPEVNGYVLVDVVDRAWPDGMGDPKPPAALRG